MVYSLYLNFKKGNERKFSFGKRGNTTFRWTLPGRRNPRLKNSRFKRYVWGVYQKRYHYVQFIRLTV